MSSRTSVLRRASLLAAAPLLAACAGPVVPIELRFPSQIAFVATTLVDFDIVPLSSSSEDLGRCPTLIAHAMSSTDLGASTSVHEIPRCDVRSGTALPDPGTGPHAYLVQARGATATILIGCTVAEAYPGGPTIRVDLFPTEAYGPAAAAVPPGSTVDGACP
jgi:hypothetical protein